MPIASGPVPVAAGRVEIRGGRDLHVAGFAGDHVHGVAGLLREHRLVGRVDAAASERHGVAEHRAAEGLRRLREKNGLARKRFGHDPAAVHALHGVGDRDGDDRRAVRRRGVDRPRDQIRRHERPRGIVHEHDVAPRVHPIEGIGDGVLAAVSARDDLHAAGGRGRRHPCRRRLGQRARQHDDDLGHAVVAEECVHAVLENRASADLEQLLRHGAAEPAAGAGRRDDRRHVHGLGRLSWGQTPIIPDGPPGPVSGPARAGLKACATSAARCASTR